MVFMPGRSVLLCIHHQPSELSLLHENGYELAVATNTSEGLRLLQAQPIDAVLVDYKLCASEGAGVAHQIKRIRPELPIIMLVDHLELPVDALQSADALVAKSDGDHFLWATVHFLLNVKPVQRQQRLQTRRPPKALDCS
jgi:response regulator RpfG family c-di-GMP phosphodiesterase